MQRGPFVIVEDDVDDQEVIVEAFKEMEIANKIHFFSRCSDAFEYLKSSGQQPFLILCDINIPSQNGIEFKRQIDADPELRAKSIPFVFFSTSIDKKSVDTAYRELTVQGFFKKESLYEDLKKTLRVIVDYWKVCKHPNS